MAPAKDTVKERLYVLIPCLNEEATIEATVEDVMESAPRLPLELHIILIDDCSKDGTAAKMSELQSRFPNIEIQRNETNLGMGKSVRTAYERIAPQSWVTVLPGDYEIPFASIEHFISLRDRYDVILGYLQNPIVRTTARRAASRAFHTVARLAYGYPWRYLNGPKLYRLEVFKDLDVESRGHAYIAEMLAKAQLRRPNLRIGEAPYFQRGRARGTSKAIQPLSVVRAMKEMFVGYRSVAAYRDEVIRKTIE